MYESVAQFKATAGPWGHARRHRSATVAKQAVVALEALRADVANATAFGLDSAAVGWKDAQDAQEALRAALDEFGGVAGGDAETIARVIGEGVATGVAEYQRLVARRQAEAERLAEKEEQARQQAEEAARRQRSAWEAAELDRAKSEAEKWSAWEAARGDYEAWKARQQAAESAAPKGAKTSAKS